MIILKLSFYLRGNMIDKSTGYEGSSYFIDYIISFRFDLKAEFDNESN